MKLPSPVQPLERAPVLDALRGFALLGIFLANSAAFCGYTFLNPELKAGLFTYEMDQWLFFTGQALVSGKFYSLFSLLFGIGFSIILLRNQHKNTNGIKIFYRRLFILFLFGCFHAFFLWDGDILMLYALLGCLLPLFNKLPNRSLILIWIFLILSPIAIDVFKMFTGWDPGAYLNKLGTESDKKFGIIADRGYLYNHNAGYDEILKWNFSGIYFRWSYLLSSNRLPKVLGMFLLGLYVGRKLIYTKLAENKILFQKLCKWGFIIGLPCSIAMAYFENDGRFYYSDPMGLADTIFYALSVVPLSLAYASAFCLLWLKDSWNKKLKLFAPAGRMALTNYLMQSVLGIILYYNIGFGLGIQFGPAIFFPLAIVIFMLQVGYSRLWLIHFNYGPAEWLWRKLVYGNSFSMKKQAVELNTITS